MGMNKIKKKWCGTIYQKTCICCGGVCNWANGYRSELVMYVMGGHRMSECACHGAEGEDTPWWEAGNREVIFYIFWMFYGIKHIKVCCVAHHRELVMNFCHVVLLINFALPGHFYVHQSCALWSSGVTRTEDLLLENVGPAVLEASKRRCSYCSHFGATITCIVTSCTRVLHFPCAAASGAFQDCKTVTMVCSQHLDQVPLLCE
jgi:hypothetical protein